MSVCKWLAITGLVAVASLGSPRAASADWVLTPFVGWNFSGSADVRNSTTNENFNFEQKVDYGVSLTGMGAGVIGFEVDFGYSPNFFETNTGSDEQFDLASNSNVGIRGDVRYFRSFRGADAESLTGLALGNLNFWRGSVGVSFKF